MKLSCDLCLIPNLVQRGHHKTSLTLVHTKYLKNNFFFCSQITFNLRKEKKKWKSTNFTIIFRNLVLVLQTNHYWHGGTSTRKDITLTEIKDIFYSIFVAYHEWEKERKSSMLLFFNGTMIYSLTIIYSLQLFRL